VLTRLRLGQPLLFLGLRPYWCGGGRRGRWWVHDAAGERCGGRPSSTRHRTQGDRPFQAGP